MDEKFNYKRSWDPQTDRMVWMMWLGDRDEAYCTSIDTSEVSHYWKGLGPNNGSSKEWDKFERDLLETCEKNLRKHTRELEEKARSESGSLPLESPGSM